MKQSTYSIFLAMLLCLGFSFLIECAGKDNIHAGPSESARISYQESLASRDTILENHKKLKQMFKIIRRATKDNSGVTIFDKIKNFDLSDEWDKIDSILQDFYVQMDLNNNPDTPENEWLDEIHRSIDYCETYFGKWWQNNDLRAYVVIQIGVDDLNYSHPYEEFCKRLDGQSGNTLCWHCQLTYDRRNIHIQLQGKYALGYFTEVTTFIDKSKPASKSTDQLAVSDAQDFFYYNIVAREEPPYYDALPEAKKDLKIACNTFIQPLGNNDFEVWSLYALPLKQFKADSNNNLNFHIDQKIWSDNNKPRIIAENQSRKYAVSRGTDLKDACCFFAVKNLLTKGDWKLISTPIEGGTKNKTIYSQDISLPLLAQSTELSSILLYVNDPDASVKKDQVMVNNQYFTGWPFRSYHPQDSLHALVTWQNYNPGKSVVVWFLSPKKQRQKGINYSALTEKFWTTMRQFDFPVLDFMEETDIVLSASKTDNTNIYKLSSPLDEVPKGEYSLVFLQVEPRLREPVKIVQTEIRVK